MGMLYDLRSKIEKVIEDRKLDASTVRGKITLQTGFLISLVTAATPDDSAKIEKLKKAAADVLQLKL
jgi:hypothetical protein